MQPLHALGGTSVQTMAGLRLLAGQGKPSPNREERSEGKLALRAPSKNGLLDLPQEQPVGTPLRSSPPLSRQHMHFALCDRVSLLHMARECHCSV